MEEAKNNIANSYLDWSDQGKASFWRCLIGFVVMWVIFSFLSGIVGLAPMMILVPNFRDSLIGSTVALLASFALSFFAIPLLVKLIHRRPFWSVAMPDGKFKAWDFWTAFWVYTAAGVVFSFPFSVIGLIPVKLNPNFDLKNLLILAVIAFIGIFIQAGAEELFFRGYITQFVRRFFSNKVLFLGIPALYFGLIHLGNISDSVSGGVWVTLPYIINGLLFGWVAYRSGSLWMALGLHLANNYSNVVMIGTIGDVLPSAAPFVVEIPNNLTLITAVVGVQALAVALAMNYLIKKREAGR